MEEENKGAQPSEEQIDETTEDNPQEESVEELKQRLSKAEELASNYKTRAEKAETALKKPVEKKEEPKPEKKAELSSLDIIHITRANLADEDVERVVKWAKDNGQSVSEALADDDLKAVLRNREEKRKSDEAASVGSARRSTTKPVGEKVVADAFKNDKIPEPGSPEAKALWEERVKARRGG